MFGREHGAKFGGGDLAGEELLKLQRKERTRAIAAEVFDLKNDPYLMRNHLGGLECRLCGTPHTHEANYMVHTEGKKHKENLAKREAAKKRSGAQAGAAAAAAVAAAERRRVTQVRKTAKIGLPGYQMVKQLDRQTNRHSLLFRVRPHIPYFSYNVPDHFAYYALIIDMLAHILFVSLRHFRFVDVTVLLFTDQLPRD